MKKLLTFGLALWLSLQSQAQTNIPAQFLHVDRNVRGVLTLPNHLPGPYATVVLVPGSGANDRDGTLLLAGGYAPCLYPQLVGQTLKPYKALADALVAAGYAVFRYDKLEYTYPTNLGSISFNKLWLPALSAIPWLKARPEIDTTQLILLGHSEGSSLIPLIAQQHPEVQALISLAGAMTPFDSVLAGQLVSFAQLCNGNVPQAQNEANQILTYFDVVRSGPPPLNTPPLFGVPAGVWRDYVLATDTVAGHYNARAKPTLFVGLGADVNVPPSELARFQGAVNVTNDFWLLPGINHFLTTNSQPTLAAPVADTLVHWLGQQGLFTALPARLPSLAWQVYPNPTTDHVELRWENPANQIGLLRLYDASGRLCLEQQLAADATQHRLPLALLPGHYRLHFQLGKAFAHRSLVILPH
jgi:pimeloyl-ACP methyl ester carboxylesterase